MIIWVKKFQTEKTIEIQLVRPAEVCVKVQSEKNGYKSVKTSLLLSYVIDAGHQNSCLFTNKGHFSSPLWVLIGVLAKIGVFPDANPRRQSVEYRLHWVPTQNTGVGHVHFMFFV